MLNRDSLHNHLSIPQLLSHIPSGSTADLDPRLTEECIGRQNEHHVKHGMEGVVNDLGEAGGRGDVIGDPPYGDGGTSPLGILPFAQNFTMILLGCDCRGADS
jgi:hypothetical protein